MGEKEGGVLVCGEGGTVAGAVIMGSVCLSRDQGASCLKASRGKERKKPRRHGRKGDVIKRVAMITKG